MTAMTTNKPKISAVILAAGSSSRLNNEPKQLLEFHGKTSLRRATKTAVAAGYHSTVVVLGAKAEILLKEIEDLPVMLTIKFVFNSTSDTRRSAKTFNAAEVSVSPKTFAAL